MSDLTDFVKNHPQYFGDLKYPLTRLGSFLFINRNFQLYLAERNKAAELIFIKHWQVDWKSPKGESKTGIVEYIDNSPIALCKCPDKDTCTKTNTCTLNVDITNTNTNKTARLCLFHSNRDNYQFIMSTKIGGLLSDSMLLDIFTKYWKDALDGFISGIKVQNMGAALDEAAKKKIYELNKTSQHCVHCGKPTYERPLFVTTIMYCPCAE